jgi:DtxR family Mn-dependent transcriptional regulator
MSKRIRAPQPPSSARASAATEDYLAAVWKTEEWGASATTGHIALTVGVTASTVSANLRRLARDGLLDYEPYGSIALTDAGRRVAVDVVRRHRIVETYLVERLGLAWDEVHDEADALEHAVSDLVLGRMDAILGHPTRDPHGDAIPGVDGSTPARGAVALDVLPVGVDATVVRIDDREPEILRYLADRGVQVGAALSTASAVRSAGHLVVVLEGRKVELTARAAADVWVDRIPPA